MSTTLLHNSLIEPIPVGTRIVFLPRASFWRRVLWWFRGWGWNADLYTVVQTSTITITLDRVHPPAHLGQHPAVYSPWWKGRHRWANPWTERAFHPRKFYARRFVGWLRLHRLWP